MTRRQFLKCSTFALLLTSFLPKKVPEVSFSIVKAPLPEPIHKLKAQWRLETADELRRAHGVGDRQFEQALIEELQTT